MKDTVIRIENLSKQYRLGVIGFGTFLKEFESFWARLLKKEDPNTRVDTNSETIWALRPIYGGGKLIETEQRVELLPHLAGLKRLLDVGVGSSGEAFFDIG